MKESGQKPSHAQLLEQRLHYPFAGKKPSPGESIELVPTVRWVRMPLPFALDHIEATCGARTS